MTTSMEQRWLENPERRHGSAVPEGAHPTERRYELDWLRVLIVLGLIPFHAIGIFTAAIDAYLGTTRTNPVLEIIASFFAAWPMPLLFLVAGAGAWFALGRRTPSQYTWERLSRLAIPFVFGTLVLIPIQDYFVLRAYPQLLDLKLVPVANPHVLDSFFQFYPEYLAGYGYFLTHFSSLREIVFWGHLWFIPRLLLYSLAALPLFLWLCGDSGRRLVSRLGDLLVRRGALILLSVPLGITLMLNATFFRPGSALAQALGTDASTLWEQLVFNLLCFLYGYIFYAEPRLLRAAARDGLAALLLGVIGFALLRSSAIGGASSGGFTLGVAVVAFLRALTVWLWVAGILGMSVRLLSFTNRALRYLNQAAYPLYVLHMPVLVILGLSVVAWRMPMPVQLIIIVGGTLVVTLGLYELVVRRISALRLLFGMKGHEQGKPTIALPTEGKK